PEPPRKTSKWLWGGAIAAVLLVTGLVLALVIVTSSSRESTVVAPLPSSTTTARPTPTIRPPSSTTRAPLPLPIPLPTSEPGTETPLAPGETAPSPTGTETVVYSVSGEGRAINITYVDTGGIMQTEFNVALPWSKEVSLSAPAKTSASVAVVNVGRDVTCSVTVNGAQVRQRTGRGLTICTGAA
ncbi:MAG: MmpS family transport accessory protein, partial [Mycobacterium sp.]